MIGVRVPALDGLRGLAIWLVMLAHIPTQLASVVQTPPPIAPTDDIILRLFASMTWFGLTGVDLFFVLSGFLITSGLLKTQGKHQYFRNFYVRRVLRILPLAYLVLMLLLWIQPPIIKGTEWAYWLFFANWTQGLSDINPGWGFSQYWSLAVEEQFYLAWPAVLVVVGRKHLPRLCLVLLAFGIIARFGAVFSDVGSFALYVLTPFRLDGLALGALIAVVGASTLHRAARYAFLLTGITLLALWIISGRLPVRELWFAPLGFSVVALFWASTLVLVLCEKHWARLFSLPFLRSFGVLSYCLYLIHEPIREVVQVVLPGDTPRILVNIIWLTVTYGIAWMSWRYIEHPLLSLGRSPLVPPTPLVVPDNATFPCSA